MGFFEFVLALVALFMVFFIMMARTVHRRDRRYAQDDTELIQELHHGLQRMSQRVETLETLLLERAPDQDRGTSQAATGSAREWRS
ncbi:MAG: hypothetical protein IT368_09225 [Candidatus Hydrogenedentes bacterium]|nr:hypothetical protein [Candidatus Hydrogenedentota bacterium]